VKAQSGVVKRALIWQLIAIVICTIVLDFVIFSASHESVVLTLFHMKLLFWIFCGVVAALSAAGALALSVRLAAHLYFRRDLNAPAYRRQVGGLIAYVACFALASGVLLNWRPA
jgi:hypothetical protein